MPAIAVGAAMYAGGTVAAAGGISAFAATYGTWAAVGAMGAIAAGIGVATGNKELTTIGAVAGLAGGVGALAQNQGWFTASELATSNAGGTVAAEAAATGAEAAAASNTSVMASAPTAGLTDPSAGLVNSGATTASTAAAGAETALTPLQAVNVGSAGSVANVTAGGSVMDKLAAFGEYMGKNKEIASLGMNFVGGMFDDEKDAKTELLKTQRDQLGLRGRLLEQQASNANSVPSLTSMKVSDKNVFKTTQPTYLGPRVGLINT